MLIELGKRRNNIIKNYEKYLPKIIKAIKEVLGSNARVYLFGSVVEGRVAASSDVDLMVVANVRGNLKKAEILAEIERRAELPFFHPFEFHLMDEKEFETWMRIFKPKVVKIG